MKIRYSKNLSTFFTSILVCVLFAYGILVVWYGRVNYTDVLLGGLEIEFQEHPYVGYALLQNSTTTKATLCTSVLLDTDLAVIPSHCCPDCEQGFWGYDPNIFKAQERIPITGRDFPYNKETINTATDFSIITLEKKLTIVSNFPTIVKPELGCNYEIVAFGRSENLTTGIKKKADSCITAIEGSQIRLQNQTSGACFGDSGGAIMKKNSSEIVGIITGGEKKAGNSVCDFGNIIFGMDLSSQIDVLRNKRADIFVQKCGERCNDIHTCADQLVCNEGTCLPKNLNSCISTLNQFCAPDKNVICTPNLKCLFNKCQK